MQIQLPMMYPLFYTDDFVNVGYNPNAPMGRYMIGTRFQHPMIPRVSTPTVKPRLTARITPTYVFIRFVEHFKRVGEEAAYAPKAPFN